MFKDYDDPLLLKRLQELLTTCLAELHRVCKLLDIPYSVYAGTTIGTVRHQGFIPWDDDIDVCMLRADYERFLREAPAVLRTQFVSENSRTNEDFPNMFTILGLKDTVFISEYIKHSPYRMPISLDIFPFDAVPADPKKYRRQIRDAWFWGRMMYLQGTPKPYLGFDSFLSKGIHVVTSIAYVTMKALKVKPKQLQGKWEQAARRYEGTPAALFTNFSDRTPVTWQVSPTELFPSVEAPFESITVNLPNAVDAILTRGYGDYMKLPPVNRRKNHQPYFVDFGPYTEVNPV